MNAEDALSAAEARIALDGYDPASVLAASLEYLALAHAEDDRPLCPSCARRRVNNGRDRCGPCEDTYRRQLEHKNTWWRANGKEWRKQWRAEREARGEE